MFHFVVLVLFLFASALNAQSPADRIAVMPAVVSGQNPASFPRDDASRDLQSMIAFLTTVAKDYPVLSPASRELLQTSPVYIETNESARIADFCRQVNSSLLFTAKVSFQGNRIRYSLSAISCLSRQVLRKTDSITEIANLQSDLQDSIRKITPQLKNRQMSVVQESFPVYIIDTSGSMATDLKTIRVTLSAMRARNQKFAAIAVEPEKIRALDARAGDSDIRAFIDSLLPFGDVHSDRLYTGLVKAADQIRVPARSTMYVITDANLNRKNAGRLESILRRMRRQGVDIRLIQTRSQSYETRQEMQRMTRAMRLEDGRVFRARRMGFLDGSYLYFVQYGSNFFTTKKNILSSVDSGRLDTDSLTHEDTVRWTADRLTFDSFAQEYARLQNKKLTNLGAVHSSFEKAIVPSTSVSSNKGKILVKNEGTSFWIQISDKRVWQKISAWKGKGPVAIALRFQPGDLRPDNIADFVYIVDEDRVAAPMVQTYDRLLKMRNRLNPENIWILKVQIIDSVW